MAVHIPQWLGGPVLEWELRRAARKPWSRGVYYGWVMLLAIQTFALAQVRVWKRQPGRIGPRRGPRRRYGLGAGLGAHR
jgi:hypothetical protein